MILRGRLSPLGSEASRPAGSSCHGKNASSRISMSGPPPAPGDSWLFFFFFWLWEEIEAYKRTENYSWIHSCFFSWYLFSTSHYQTRVIWVSVKWFWLSKAFLMPEGRQRPTGPVGRRPGELSGLRLALQVSNQLCIFGETTSPGRTPAACSVSSAGWTR